MSSKNLWYGLTKDAKLINVSNASKVQLQGHRIRITHSSTYEDLTFDSVEDASGVFGYIAKEISDNEQIISFNKNAPDEKLKKVADSNGAKEEASTETSEEVTKPDLQVVK